MLPLSHTVAKGALVRTAPPPAGAVAEAEQALRASIERMATLEDEIERLGQRLGEFSSSYESRLGAVCARLDRAERLVRRLQRIEDEIERLLAPEPADGQPARRPRPWRADGPPPSPSDEPEPEPDEAAPEDSDLKRLYRRLVRLLHPDLARDDEERARLTDWMARINAAYGKGDRTPLEILAAKIEQAEPLADPTDEDRIEHARRRIEAIDVAIRSLAQERHLLQSTSTWRLLEEAERRAAEGRDYFAETIAALEREAKDAFADARARIAALEQHTRNLNARTRSPMQTPSSPQALRRVDPLSESPLIRRGVQSLDREQATADARTLARDLEQAAVDRPGRPWEAALTLWAFFAEVAGRPPEGLGSADGWTERYESLRADWPEAPGFDEAMANLPAHLEIGLRRHGPEVRFGVQLARADLVAGVRIALERERFLDLGRRILSTLGPRESCPRCRSEVYLAHRMRTRGLDDVHALVCPRCGLVRKSYRLLGQVQGIEALGPFAMDLGLVSEQVVRLGGRSIGFQFLPFERERLTAAAVVGLFMRLYVEPYGIEMGPGDLRLRVGAKTIRPSAILPAGATVTLVVDRRTGLSESQLVELLRARIEQRFRPEAPAEPDGRR